MEECRTECIICHRWFQACACCHEPCECVDVQKFNNLCGECSGIGPMTQSFVPIPSKESRKTIETQMREHSAVLQCERDALKIEREQEKKRKQEELMAAAAHRRQLKAERRQL